MEDDTFEYCISARRLSTWYKHTVMQNAFEVLRQQIN